MIADVDVHPVIRLNVCIKVLIVEDIITTGGSVMEVIEALKPFGGEITGVGLLADRSGGKIDFGVRKEALLTLKVENYQSEKCPLCQKGIPLTKRGSKK